MTPLSRLRRRHDPRRHAWRDRLVTPAALSLAALLGAAGVVLALSIPARGHDAPSGWRYDLSCCSQRDCAPAPPGAVVATPQGWRIRLQPGQHPMVRDTPFDVLVPHTDGRIRPSGDAEFHPCISPSGQVLCLYVPPFGA